MHLLKYRVIELSFYFNFFEKLSQRNKKLFVLNFAMSITWFLIELGFVYVLKIFLNSISTENEDSLNKLFYIMSVFFTYGVARSIIYFYKYLTLNKIQSEFLAYLRKRIVKYLYEKDLNTSNTDWIDRYNDKAKNSSEFVRQLASLWQSASVSILLLLFCIYFAPVELSVGLFLLTLGIFPAKYLSSKISELGREVSKISQNLNRSYVGNLRNIKLLKISRKDKKITRKLIKDIDTDKSIHEKAYIYTGINQVIPLVLAIIIILIITLVTKAYTKTNTEKLISFFYLFIRMSQNLSYVYNAKSNMQLWKPSYIKLNNDLGFSKKNKKNQQKSLEVKSIKTIKLKNINFSFKEKNIFKNFSLNIAEKDVVIIKGSSGVGKSTLLSLLSGILKPQSGSIMINEIDIEKIDFYSTNTFGYVGPDCTLIPGTIRQNLLYPNLEKISDEIIINVLKSVQLFDWVYNQTWDLDTFLSDESVLSTGQRQRISIARIILQKPEVMIFDEPTANLDVDTSQHIAKLISSISKFNILIIVSHKNLFDRIGTKRVNL